MPRLNRKGEACGGLGDGRAWVDGQIFAGSAEFPAGGTQWLDDDRIIYQTYENAHTDENAILQACNIRTGKKERIIRRGANFIIAGGGRYAAWLRGHLFGALESRVAGVLAAGHDGTLAIVNNYQQNRGFTLYAPDGTQTRGPEIPVLDMQVLGPDSCIWGGHDLRIHTLNTVAPQQLFQKIWRPRLVRVRGEWWVVYYAEEGNFGGLVAHPAQGSTDGYIIGTGGNFFYHDAIEHKGQIRVVWSHTNADRPSDFRRRDIDLNEERTSFAGRGGRSIAFRSLESRRSSIGLTANTGSNLIRPQLGLLEDDIVYRLSLLAVNVLQPLKNRYPNIIIRSGFREVNSGIGQHELGEAVDIQIRNQTDRLLLEVANYIRNHLPFDQLILNWSNVGERQGWIHVSFSPNALRRQVLTKDFADVFHEGLFLIEPLTGEDAAAALREQSDLDSEILFELEKMQARQQKLQPATTIGDELIEVTTGVPFGESTPGAGGEAPLPPDFYDSRRALVSCVKSKLNLQPGNQETNIRNAFEVTIRVAWLLRGEGAGLLAYDADNNFNVVPWNGYNILAGYIAYPDGQIYQILSKIAGGEHTPMWSDGGREDPSHYVPAMNPGGVNQDWLTCDVPIPGKPLT